MSIPAWKVLSHDSLVDRNQVHVVLMAIICWCSLWIVVPLSAFQERSTQDDPEAVQLYNTGANLYGDQQYQLAIDQWTTLLDKYPEYSLRRDAEYYRALAHYNLQQFDLAAQRFTALKDSLPGLNDYRRAENLMFYLAYSQYRTGKSSGPEGVKQLKDSLQSYEQLLETFPKSKLAAEAAYFRGEAIYTLQKLDDSVVSLTDATEAFQGVVDSYPDSPNRNKAHLAWADCLAEAGQYAEAVNAYESFLTDFPDDPQANNAGLGRADATVQLAIALKNAGDQEDARTLFEQADREYHALSGEEDFPLRAHALNQRAYCLLHLNQLGEAADLFANVATNFPDAAFADSSALDAGRYYFASGNMEAAEQWLGKCRSEKDGRFGEATHWLCQVKLNQEQYQAALDLANEALQGDPSRFQVNLLMDAADAMYGIEERKPEAIEAYLSLAKAHPEHSVAAKAQYYAAFGQMSAGQHTAAIKSANQFLESWPESEFLADTQEVLAQSALQSGDHALARTTFQSLVRDFPDHARMDWWLTRIGWADYQAGNFDEAIASLTSNLSKIKDAVSQSEARYVIGTSQYEIRNFEKAIEFLNQSLETQPERQNAEQIRLLVARSHQQLGETDSAIRLAKAVNEDTGSAQSAYWLAEFQYQAGQFEDAATNYQAALDNQPDPQMVPDLLYGLAWASSSHQDNDVALASFNRLIEDYPDHPLATESLVGRGKTRRVAGDFAGAIKDLSAYLENLDSDKSPFNATFERALCYVGTKEWEAAIRDLEAIDSEREDHPELADDILFELAWARKENGDDSGAEEAFQAIADNYPESNYAAEASYHVGQKHYANNEFDEARRRYTVALESSEDARVSELAAYKLGWCAFKLNDFEGALKAFQDQTSRFTTGDLHAIGLCMIGESFFQMDQFQQAVEAYSTAIPAIRSSDVTNNIRVLAPIHASQSANKIKEFQQAIDFAKPVIDEQGDSEYVPEALFETGVAWKGLNENDKASEAWTLCMTKSLGKTGARARCMIGELLFEQKNFNEAADQFKLVIYGYGGTDSAADVKPWQAFAAYEAARCYHVQIADSDSGEPRTQLIDNARKLYQMLVDQFPDDRLAADARKQIAVLDSLDQP